ncbi:insulinase family protein [Mucilaginibacter rubeus]|uniref:Insulinase family protein n=1 Tax=Mucilaginibacter rubeus TaxID=2027860 RepID=A0AAE6MKJ1_9SPHI|nr:MULTISPECIES: M16 family metallopeptidase [Mucilaginibacter]QEM06337.1 insulinase family protein [Mucilaginibacter rubeus]QEM18920.1 insulinase family protein [Mucilaginibacter gossypii]QTE44538.1 insulinase family protein [Mucilaginibacter rubeus]QTE51136.1 insulinase family protein [Mucilaginibacter rubeus]QTE56222.1 insulinase family protein [Mucilaginibacter rubeus]
MNLNKYVPLALLALTLSGGSAFAQVKKKPVPSPKNKPGTQAIAAKSDILPVDKDVIIGKLPNGLTYYIRANVEPKSRAELYLVNKAGSVLENDDQQGLAHFTEHMAFNGTRDFPKNQMVDYLQKAGVKFGADLNAYTSFNETVYQLPLPTDTVNVFEKGFNILANWAGYVSFDPAEIDKERGVVLEEERLRGKNAQERLQQQTLPVLLNNSRYALRLPIGKEDILKNFKPETIKAFYQDWYRPDLQAVVAVGDFDPKRVEALIKQNFSQLKNPAAEKPRTKYSVPATPGTAVKIVTDPEYPYTVAQIIVKHPGTVTKTTGDYMQQVRVQLFNQMLNSRINELLQKPNPPFLYGRTSYGNFIGDQDAYTSLVVAKPGELEKAVKAVVAESERARKFGFTLTELERAKQDALVGIGNAYRERDKTPSANFVREYQANFLTGEAIPGISYEYNFYIGNIYKVSLADMNAMAGKFISDQNRVVVVQAPDKEKANLPDEKTLLNWIATGGQNVTAYIDNVSSDPLLAKVPEGTKVAKEETDEALGTTTLTLGNGLKVILKPTEYRNDQILINGYAFGGTSLASDDEFTSANLASSIISGSGIAQFNQGMLDKKLAGKNLSISPYISEFAQGISGNTSPADFETALQLIYLYFTQPRKDKDIWDANIDQTRSVLSTRGLDPGSVYQDTVSAVLSNYNFRGMVTTLPRLNAATLDKAYDFYKKRFADASGFTFTLVGNFNVETIKPYLEHYLGGLPSTNSKETYKNMNIEPPAGLITKTVNKGVGEKSTVQLVFSGDYDYNEANNIQVDALDEVLNIKLIERLREQESGVYAPGVRAGYHKIPGGRYTFTISFGCAPENVDKLINATMEEIAKIKQNGALPVDIQKFVAEEARSTQQQLKQNVFWAGYLASTSQNGENPDQILGHVSSLEQITPQSTKDAANKYLSGKNLIKLILMPEKK